MNDVTDLQGRIFLLSTKTGAPIRVSGMKYDTCLNGYTLAFHLVWKVKMRWRLLRLWCFVGVLVTV